MDNEITVNSRVRRRATGEFGVVIHLDGDLCDVMFAQSGRSTLHVSDLQLAPSDPLALLGMGALSGHEEYVLRLKALYLQHAYRFDALSGLSNARIEPKLHQVFVAHRVGRKPRPRMILADEVGLGKTIEAGLIIKEQIARGLAERILVVCPASLQHQWQYELGSKFNEEFTIIDGPSARMLEKDGSNPWNRFDKVIVSTNLARREDRALQIIDASWDMAVFDEAHHVRRRYEGPDRYRATQAYRLADELKDLVDGLLLLTATPMQLHPFELYSLIELVEPGLFPSFDAYDAKRKAIPRLNEVMRDLQRWTTLHAEEQEQALRQHQRILQSIGVTGDAASLDDPERREVIMDALTEHHPSGQTMVRNRKSIVGGFTRRKPVIRMVDPSPDEDAVFGEVEEYIAEGYNRARKEQDRAVGFLMVLYQKMLTSSSNALRSSFMRRVAKLRTEIELATAFASGDLSEEELDEIRGSEELEDAIERLEEVAINRQEAEWEVSRLEALISRLGKIHDSKARALLDEVIDPWLSEKRDEKVLVFTGFIDTQSFLATVVEAAGYEVVVFNGKMSLDEKEAAVRKFRGAAQVMITTEAGGEGRNFQFAHVMVNYDLPWNPMVVEQRIGRLDRIGQNEDVSIYNLALAGTVEERVLDVLHTRIGLFEESVGSLDPILGEVERDLERLLMGGTEQSQVEIDEYGADLEKRVKEARVKESLLADFILDRASLRFDEAHRLLGEEPLARWSDLRDFTSEALEFYGGRVSRHREGGYSLSLSPNLSHRLGINEAVSHGEFDPAEALQREDLEFFAFGHETIDALVEWAGYREALTGARRLATAPRGVSVEVVYELESQGVLSSGQLIRHLIGSNLMVSEEVLTTIPESGERIDVPVPGWVEAAIGASRRHIQLAYNEARDDAQARDAANRESEIERAKRVYRFQRDHLEQRIHDGEAWTRQVEAAGSEGQRRVLPARLGRLNKDRGRLASLKANLDLQVEAIQNRRADVRLRTIAAGIVVGP